MKDLEEFLGNAILAAQGDLAAWSEATQAFKYLEEAGYEVADPIRRIWNGERDKVSLVAGLDRESAVIVASVLASLAVIGAMPSLSEAALAAAAATENAAPPVDAFPTTFEDVDDALEATKQLKDDIVAAARGHAIARQRVETWLPKLEAGGCPMGEPIRFLWSGKRDSETFGKVLIGAMKRTNGQPPAIGLWPVFAVSAAAEELANGTTAIVSKTHEHPSSIEPGELMLDRYLVQERLSGGMGVVYLCEDLPAEQNVAIKTLRPEFLRSREAADRFLREADIWIRLGDHPNIVRAQRIRLLGTRHPCVVLDMVRKRTGRLDASLRSRLSPGDAIPVAEALLIAKQITCGLAHATRCVPGLVHRDLKPENILVGPDLLPGTSVERARVTDFGLVSVIEGQLRGGRLLALAEPGQGGEARQFSRTTITPDWVGTPLYMAPELWRRSAAGAATDVYALGCILFEMATGGPVARGASIGALREAHLNGLADEVDDPELPKAIVALIQRCIALEPADRYQSWNELEAELVRLYESVTGLAAPRSAEVGRPSPRSERLTAMSIMDLGIVHQQMGRVEVAIQHFKQVLDLARGAHDLVMTAKALGNLGSAHCAQGDPQTAIRYCEEAREMFRNASDRVEEAVVLCNLGSAWLELGHLKEALRCGTESLQIARDQRARWIELTALRLLASAHIRAKDPVSAIRYIEEAQAIPSKTAEEDAQLLHNLSAAHLQLGDASRAIECLQERLTAADRDGDLRAKGRALGNMGLAHFESGDHERAIQTLRSACDASREAEDWSAEAQSLDNLAHVWEAAGVVGRAIQCRREALTIHRRIRDRESSR